MSFFLGGLKLCFQLKVFQDVENIDKFYGVLTFHHQLEEGVVRLVFIEEYLIYLLNIMELNPEEVFEILRVDFPVNAQLSVTSCE